MTIDKFLKNKIRENLLELLRFSEKPEIELQALSDKLNDMLTQIDDLIDSCIRDKSKSLKTNKKSLYPIGR